MNVVREVHSRRRKKIIYGGQREESKAQFLGVFKITALRIGLIGALKTY